MSPEILAKDPDEIRIMTFDWVMGLNSAQTVSGINDWAASPSGLTFSQQTIVAGGLQTSAKIAGGTAGTIYVVTNTITTSDGETLEESGKLEVKHSIT